MHTDLVLCIHFQWRGRSSCVTQGEALLYMGKGQPNSLIGTSISASVDDLSFIPETHTGEGDNPCT